jgi:hypothetical protein
MKWRSSSDPVIVDIVDAVRADTATWFGRSIIGGRVRGGGFAISMPTLFEKSGAEGDYRCFKFEIGKIAAKDALPGYALMLEQAEGKKEPSLRMIRRDEEKGQPRAKHRPAAEGQGACPPSAPLDPVDPLMMHATLKSALAGLTQKAVAGYVTDETLALLRGAYPGWDYQVLHADFKSWIGVSPERTPVNYQAAFIGFVKRHHEKNAHTLR